MSRWKPSVRQAVHKTHRTSTETHGTSDDGNVLANTPGTRPSRASAIGTGVYESPSGLNMPMPQTTPPAAMAVASHGPPSARPTSTQPPVDQPRGSSPLLATAATGTT